MITRKASRKRALVTQEAEASLEELSGRFEGWRSTREGLSPIPDALWAAAVEAAREQGVNRVVRRLGLSYSELKRRVRACLFGTRVERLKESRSSSSSAAIVDPVFRGARCCRLLGWSDAGGHHFRATGRNRGADARHNGI